MQHVKNGVTEGFNSHPYVRGDSYCRNACKKAMSFNSHPYVRGDPYCRNDCRNAAVSIHTPT